MTCDYGDAAQTAYKNMVKCFSDPNCSDYWKLGNAFDSMTDYLRWWGGLDHGLMIAASTDPFDNLNLLSILTTAHLLV